MSERHKKFYLARLLLCVTTAPVSHGVAQELGLDRWDQDRQAFRMASPTHLAVWLAEMPWLELPWVLVLNPAFGTLAEHRSDALVREQFLWRALPVPDALQRPPAVQSLLFRSALESLLQGKKAGSAVA